MCNQAVHGNCQLPTSPAVSAQRSAGFVLPHPPNPSPGQMASPPPSTCCRCPSTTTFPTAAATSPCPARGRSELLALRDEGRLCFFPQGKGRRLLYFVVKWCFGGNAQGGVICDRGGLGCVVRFAGPQSHPNTIFVVILMWSFLRNATFDQKWSMRGGMGWGSGGGGPH